MSVARRLAEFLTETRATDLPPQTLDYAAMLIASTIASAAAGRDIDSARIIRELAKERGGPMAAANTRPARESHAGLATMLGINAALAAQRGFRGKGRILECRHGFFETYGGIEATVAGTESTRDLGGSWDIVTDMAVKLMPGGHPYHALAEAAANAARDGDV